MGTVTAVLSTVLAVCAGTLGLVVAPAGAGAAGILPPANPPANIAPSSSDYLSAIDTARAAEGVGQMTIAEQGLDGLTVPEQLFVVINLERIDRGLPPMEYLSSTLDSYAQAGANAGSDPSFPTALPGTGPLQWGGAVWAGGTTNILEADYYWMYDDGWGGLLSATSNAACNLLNLSECWGHRDIILHQFASCGGAAPVLSMGTADSTTTYPGGSVVGMLVSTCQVPTDVVMSWSQVVGNLLTSKVVAITPLLNGTGYWEVNTAGLVAGFGNAQYFGDLSGETLNSPIVGMAATPDGQGYWLVAADGGIFSYGDAIFRGSMGGHRLNQPIVGMATDLATGGYWLVASDGGIFSFGSPFFGSTGALHLVKPIVGMEALSNGKGYRFEAADGGVFDFGQATFDGSMGGKSLVAPVTGMANDAATGGYWLVAADGGIFGYGGASFLGRLLLSL